MREFMNISKALSDATRVRVLMALRHQELCACQITELFGLAPSTMSKHFYLLNQAGLVNTRKEGRWIYYSLPGESASPAAREAIEWINRSLAKEPRILQDARQLKQILQCDPAELCKQQCQK